MKRTINAFANKTGEPFSRKRMERDLWCLVGTPIGGVAPYSKPYSKMYPKGLSGIALAALATPAPARRRSLVLSRRRYVGNVLYLDGFHCVFFYQFTLINGPDDLLGLR